MRVDWVSFLHMYQPPLQDNETIEWVLTQSYRYLFSLFPRFPYLRLTLNITGCLMDRLFEDNKNIELLSTLKRLISEERIELVGSAAYHPILPLLPKEEVIRQIKINDDINYKFLGELYNPVGFFLPEMAYNFNVAQIISELGYRWIIVDSVSTRKKIKNNVQYKIQDTKLTVVFRNREISNTFVPLSIAGILQKKSKERKIIITATDAELYGHHHQDTDCVFESILVNKDLKIMTVSDYIATLKNTEIITLQSSSWETTLGDIKNNNPYPLWNDKTNKIQMDLWKITYYALQCLSDNLNDPNYYWARVHLDRGLASCTYWWCSARKPSPFCPFTWNPDEVSKGLGEIIKSIRSLNGLESSKKVLAEQMYFKIQKKLWTTHWNNYNNR